jgi:peptidoglycan/xylan/chitin deacetylase (PgdA/CDA1 family)
VSAPDEYGGGPQPEAATGSAPGWPVVLRFGRIHPDADPARGDLTPDALGRALDEVLRGFKPADPCVLMANHDLIRCDTPAVLVTFDHGYRDQVEHAVPRLEERGIRALFFVYTGTVREHPTRPPGPWLDWETCRELRGTGHVLGSHGTEPRAEHRAAPAESRAQVVRSLHDLRLHVGIRRGLYAYPQGVEASVPRHVPRLGTLLAFGGSRTPARPWTDAPLAVRRTHLPAVAPESWPGLVRGWREQWERV